MFAPGVVPKIDGWEDVTEQVLYGDHGREE